jgi:hypothetical protein
MARLLDRRACAQASEDQEETALVRRSVLAGETTVDVRAHHVDVGAGREVVRVTRTDFEAVVERLADDDLATFASLLDEVYVGDEDDERRTLRVLDRIRPRLQREPYPR